MEYRILSNGVKMPQLGYGVYQVTKGTQQKKSVCKRKKQHIVRRVMLAVIQETAQSRMQYMQSTGHMAIGGQPHSGNVSTFRNENE